MWCCLNNLGDKLLKVENFELAIDEIVWLVCTLGNQQIMINNIKTNSNEPLLTADDVELFTMPYDLSAFKEAIISALNNGMERSIHSEPAKNTTAG